MAKGFYLRFALDSLKKNRRYYLPYALTCMLMQGLFYIVAAISRHPGLEQMRGGGILSQFLFLGIWIMAIFSVVFLWYTHGFLMKQRKAEFGLYHVLGMEKRHIARIVGAETLMLALGSCVAALGLGLLLNKLALLGLTRLLGEGMPLVFRVSWYGIALSAVIFGAIHLLLYLVALVQIYRSSPIALLRSGQLGEREPKARWLLALLGLAALLWGYGISLTVEGGPAAISWFFLAVLLVIVATYLIFMAGSIAWLKLMKARPGYYYKTRHFINVSGMLYRMKQNAASLASICILSTMVLVTVSGTTSLYLGTEDLVLTRYPRMVNLTVSYGTGAPDPSLTAAGAECFAARLGELGLQTERPLAYQRFSCFVTSEGERLPAHINQEGVRLIYVCLEDYNRMAGTDYQLEPGQVLIYHRTSDAFSPALLAAVGGSGGIVGRVEEPIAATLFSNDSVRPGIGVVAADWADFQAVYEAYRAGRENYRPVELNLGADLSGGLPENWSAAVGSVLMDNPAYWPGECIGMQMGMQAEERVDFVSTFSGLLFVGLFLSLIFLIATILIIYYKQISEGLQDARRFEIMQKVGLSQAEIRGSIRSQVMTVFFLPLAVAGLHCAFAFPIINRMLAMLSMDNTRGFVWCMAICFLIFSLVYVLVYVFTARSYYTIVSGQHNDR